jgi:hypothetical protein
MAEMDVDWLHFVCGRIYRSSHPSTRLFWENIHRGFSHIHCGGTGDGRIDGLANSQFGDIFSPLKAIGDRFTTASSK